MISGNNLTNQWMVISLTLLGVSAYKHMQWDLYRTCKCSWPYGNDLSELVFWCRLAVTNPISLPLVMIWFVSLTLSIIVCCVSPQTALNQHKTFSFLNLFSFLFAALGDLVTLCQCLAGHLIYKGHSAVLSQYYSNLSSISTNCLSLLILCFLLTLFFEGQFQNSYTDINISKINNVKMREIAFRDFGYNITRRFKKKLL